MPSCCSTAHGARALGQGEGARLFSTALVYDFIEIGPDRSDVSFRQLVASAAQLQTPARFARSISGLPPVFSARHPGAVERIVIMRARRDALFRGCPAPSRRDHRPNGDLGFDDPDIHVAVLDGVGAVLAATPGFARTALSEPRSARLRAKWRAMPTG